MGNRAEIVVTAKNLASAAIKVVNDDMKAMGATTAAVSQGTVAAMSNIGAGATTAAQKVKDASKAKVQSFEQAKQAATGLAGQIGVSLPEATSKWLASTQTIGPALTTAFSGVAVLGLVNAISQLLLPAINSITTAITGWGDASKKAYADFLSDNAKALKAADDLKHKMAETGMIGLTGSDKSGAEAKLTKAELDELKRRQASFQKSATFFKHQAGLPVSVGVPKGEFGDVEPAAVGETRVSGYSPDELKDMGDKYQRLADELAADIRAKGAALAQGIKTAEEELAAEIEQLTSQLWANRRAQRAYWDSQGFQFGLDSNTDLNARSDAITGESVSRGRQLVGAIEAGKKQSLALAKAAEESMREDADIQLKTLTGKWEQHQKNIADGTKDLFDYWDQQTENARKQAGAFWDFFFDRGRTMTQKLLDEVRSFAKSIFVNLVAGGGQSKSGGFLGGVLSRIFGGGGQGEDGEGGGGLLGKIPGLGSVFGGAGSSSGGGLGLLGGLVGHSAIVPSATPLVGTGVTGGGLTIAGMSLTTAIPVIGAGILAGFGLYKLFRHHTQEAPFYEDPLKNGSPARTIEFHTANEYRRGTEALRDAVLHLKGMKPGQVVTVGMEAAVRDNRFRVNTASALMGDM